MAKIKLSLFTPGIHIFVWAVLLTIPAIIFHNASGGSGLPGAFFLFTNLYHIGLFYLNILFLYPRLMTRGRWPLYLLALAAVFLLSYFCKLYIVDTWYPELSITPFVRRMLLFPPIPFLIASTIFCVVSDRIRLERLEKERKAERLAAELKFLRQQINPHFLFNMMTNMVSLARQGSPLLEASLIKLADMLRYSLYESGEGKIPLAREVGLIKNFIDLQQLRFGEDVDIQLSIPNDDPEGLIEPMLLVPFVENAFKHGIGLVREPFIYIAIKMAREYLFFTVTNNYYREGEGSGIGLTNIRSRLELLYPGRHKLSITDKDEIYTVELNLDLSC